MSERAIKLRLLELNAELEVRRAAGEDRRLALLVRVFNNTEARVVEAKIVALNQALSDLEAAR